MYANLAHLDNELDFAQIYNQLIDDSDEDLEFAGIDDDSDIELELAQIQMVPTEDWKLSDMLRELMKMKWADAKKAVLKKKKSKKTGLA